jgi:hypothetical protein
MRPGAEVPIDRRKLTIGAEMRISEELCHWAIRILLRRRTSLERHTPNGAAAIRENCDE